MLVESPKQQLGKTNLEFDLTRVQDVPRVQLATLAGDRWCRHDEAGN
jgi:hypothetical protein